MLYPVSSCDIGSITISDHAPVYLQFSHGEAQQRSNKWRFNNHLLNDPNFISFFQTEFQPFFSCNNTPDVSPSLLWETCKAYSRGLIISYEKSTKRKRQEEQRILELQLSECEKAYIQSPTDTNLKATLTTRTTLNSLLTQKAEQSIRFARQKLYEFGNKPTKYLASLVKNRPDSQNISSVKDDSGQVKRDSNGINKVFTEFYGKLYMSEQPAGVSRLMEGFFCNLNLPKPNDQQKTVLNGPITLEEVAEAVGVLQSGKAPGPDGFSSDFYNCFKPLLVKPLLAMFNHSFEKRAFPKTLTEANISLILKKDKPADVCSSYRPI